MWIYDLYWSVPYPLSGSGGASCELPVCLQVAWRWLMRLLVMLVACTVLVTLWYTLSISLAVDHLDKPNDEDDDGGWGDDFPGHQAAIIARNIQLALSYSWYTYRHGVPRGQHVQRDPNSGSGAGARSVA